MRHDKYQHSSILDRVSDIRDRLDIIGKGDSRQVLLVLVILIDDLGEFTTFELPA